MSDSGFQPSFTKPSEPGRAASFSRQKKCLLLALLLFSLLLPSACGYGLRGTRELPGGYRKVAIMPFANRTYESLVENYIYNALVEEFARGKSLEVVSAAAADLLIRGTVTKVESYSISYSPDDKTYEYRVSLFLNVEAVDARTLKVVWARNGMHEVEEYKASSEPLEIDRNKQTALKKICLVLAENIHDGLFNNF